MLSRVLLCGPIDYSLTGSSVRGISQARITEWVAISSCRDLRDQGIEPVSLASPILAGRFFTTGFPGGSAGKESTCNVGDLGSILDWEDPLEKGKATYSRILAWRIPWTV